MLCLNLAPWPKGIILSVSCISEVALRENEQVWGSLIEYFKKDLALSEKLALLQTRRNCFGIVSASQHSGNKGKKNVSISSGKQLTIQTSQVCHICGKTDHVLSTDKNGRKHVEVFVEMSPKLRREQLQKKKPMSSMLDPRRSV